MDITTTFTTTPRTVMQSYRACHRTAYVARWAVCAGMVLIGALTGYVVLVVLGVLAFVIAELSVRRQLAPYLKGVRQVTVSMTDTEYKTTGPDRATARTWTTFTRVIPRGGFWVLRISKSSSARSAQICP